MQAINASMTKWLTGPKTPGLMILEHELNNETVQAFVDAYPLMISSGWKLESAADADGKSVYLNSDDDSSPVQRANGVLLQSGVAPPSSSSSSSSPAKPTATPDTGNNGNAGSNTSQSGKNGSIRSTISKLAGALGAIFLTVVFYAW